MVPPTPPPLTASPTVAGALPPSYSSAPLLTPEPSASALAAAQGPSAALQRLPSLKLTASEEGSKSEGRVSPRYSGACLFPGVG